MLEIIWISKTNNLRSVLFETLTGIAFRDRVDLGVMTMNSRTETLPLDSV